MARDFFNSLLEVGANRFLRRLSYVEFFGRVLDYVPEFAPHEQGTIMLDAISRPFMPRLLFPDKAMIDDTERTNLYTGGSVKGNVKGTSISLGYIAECYIDFGEYWMMIAIAQVGYFYGRIYSAFLEWRSAGALFGNALASSILFGALGLESSFTKIFGGVVVSILAAWIVVHTSARHSSLGSTRHEPMKPTDIYWFGLVAVAASDQITNLSAFAAGQQELLKRLRPTLGRDL